MKRKGFSCPGYLLIVVFCALTACKNTKRPPVSVIAQSPEELEQKVPDLIRTSLEFAAANSDKIDDSVSLFSRGLVQQFYEKNGYAAIWSDKEEWRPIGDSLLHFIADARLFGLFPQDYYFPLLDSLDRRFDRDSLHKKDKRDAALWSKSDLLLTDAFLHIVKDIKLGRLPQDSITLRKDSVLADEFYLQRLALVQRNSSLSLVFHSLEPRQEGYALLKEGLPRFLDSADYKKYTPVPVPKDPLYKEALQHRLYEGGYLAADSIPVDSATLAEGVKRFQRQKGITVDGKAGTGTIRLLNTTDEDRFVSIAISMDRYKMLPEIMPDRYVWVNLPSFYMKLHEGDSIKMVSKIICGKPLTRTPLLTSAISELITYPQWTIPTSIIVKEVLPGLKKNPDYLAKKGFSLINAKGDEVDPYTVDWSKYTKGIPYKVVQGSGDDNALGILKFNFPNKYAVYLHDTNQRYLFAQTMRSLSHGCVRVQDWQQLAYDIIRHDNPKSVAAGKPSPTEDSLLAWLDRKEKHSIYVRNRLPVYIRYFTCEGKNGGIEFYDDIYGEDKLLREKFFAGK